MLDLDCLVRIFRRYQLGTRHPAARVLRAFAKFSESEKDAPSDPALILRKLLQIDPIGGFRDGAAHAAGFGITLQSQGRATSSLPGLEERMGQQRQRPRLVARVVE